MMTRHEDAAPLASPPRVFDGLSLRRVMFGYTRDRTVLEPVDWRVEPGECWGILGPNGAGKTTLLRLVCGLLAGTGGEIELSGKNLREWSPRERARRISYLPQRLVLSTELTALEVVLLGRYPYRALNFFESAEDLEVARTALTRTGAAELANRRLSTLSGGEAQRVHLAACLAQGAPLIVLDEPTASLDVRHQIECLRIVRDHVRREGGAALVALHDVNLALRYCTHVLLLDRGRVVSSGPPLQALTPEALRNVFGVRFDRVHLAHTGMTVLAMDVDSAEGC